MSVTYTAVLDVSGEGVEFLSGLLDAERLRRGTRARTRSLSTREQAVLVLRRLFDDTRVRRPARDGAVGLSTASEYRDEAAGRTRVILDGTLIRTGRVSAPGPTRGVDPWWSGEHRRHGGNVQAVSAPDGWPSWSSDVRPGREHDTTAARADPDLLDQVRDRVDDGRLGLADLGYEGDADPPRIPTRRPRTCP